MEPSVHDNTSDKMSDRVSVWDQVEQRYKELVEEQAQLDDPVFVSGHELSKMDSNLVFLDGEEHPRAWQLRKKAITTTIVAAFCFLPPFASTIFAPSINLIMQDMGITDSALGNLQVSIFMIGFALGPLFLSPLSEVYGRSVVVNLSNVAFAAFSLGGGFAHTPAQLAVIRLIEGTFGSSAIAVVGGILTDLWELEARPKVSGLVMLGPVLGPILGPVCGGWMSEQASWRWTLWIPAIATAVLCAVSFVFLNESYGPRVLQAKLLREKKSRPESELYTVLDLARPTGPDRSMVTQFIRPILFLLVDPALFIGALLYSVPFGVMYLIIVTYVDVFGAYYHQSAGLVGTDFLALGAGMLIGTIGTVKVAEHIYKTGVSQGRKYTPESRLVGSFFGVVVSAAGLFMYGFSAMKTSLAVPLVGSAIFAGGVTSVMVSLQLFAVDGFQFSASTFGAMSFLRCIFAGVFPLFGGSLFDALGVDWGTALLAFIVLGIGLPFGLILYIFGGRLRALGARNIAKIEKTN